MDPAELTLGLLVAVVEDDVGGVVDASGEVLHGAFAELVDPEDDVVDVGDPVYVVLKDVDAERMEEVCEQEEDTHVLKWWKISRQGSQILPLPRFSNATVFDAGHGDDRVGAVQANAADHREFCVGPVQTVVEVVHRQTCGDRTGEGSETTRVGCEERRHVQVNQGAADLWATGCSPGPESVSVFRPWRPSRSLDGSPSRPSTWFWRGNRRKQHEGRANENTRAVFGLT